MIMQTPHNINPAKPQLTNQFYNPNQSLDAENGSIAPSTQVLNTPLNAASQNIYLQRKQTLYHAGDRANSLYRVHEGLIRVIRTTPEGRLMTLRHVMPGDFFGEEALVNSNRVEVAEALTNVTIEAIDPTAIDFADLQSVTHSMANQMQRLMAYEYHLQTGDLRQRVARYLIQLAQTPLAVQNDAGHMMVSATHELLAEGTSSTRESVSKIITDLRNENLIASGYRSIVLLQWEELIDIAEEIY